MKAAPMPDNATVRPDTWAAITPVTVRAATTLAETEEAAQLFFAVTLEEHGYGPDPKWHWDMLRPQETYLDNPRQPMFVAIDDQGRIVGCSAIRIGGPLSPPHPKWLSERYQDRQAVAQLMRVAVHPHYRRRGLARRLVAAAHRFVQEEHGYRVLYFHTNTRHPAAEPFWHSLGAEVVFDARGTEFDADKRFDTVHFELPLNSVLDTSPKATTFDAASWYRRWDRQQEGFVPNREAAMQRVLSVIERLGGTPTRILDLAAGPGSLASRAHRRFPQAHIDAVELDPMLVRVGLETHGSALDWHELDLRDPGWHQEFEPGCFDAVVSATALHYLRGPQMAGVVAGLAQVLRPGGVFCDLDTLRGEPNHPRLTALLDGMREEHWSLGFAGNDRDTWTAWWEGLRSEPGMEDLWAERERRFEPRTPGAMLSLGQVTSLLTGAGFAEWEIVEASFDKRLLVAVR